MRRTEGLHPDRLELHITYTCPAKCLFCSEEFRMDTFADKPVPMDEAKDILSALRAEGVEHVNFTGGEPSIFPRLDELLAFAHSLGMRTYMATNGVLTSRAAFAERVLPHLDELSFSIHGHTATVHDALTLMPGSFANLVASMKAAQRLRAAGGRLRTFMNCVVNRMNVDSVAPMIRLAATLKVEQFLLSNVSSEGGGRTLFRDLVVPLAEWRARTPGWNALAAAHGVSLRYFALPFCVLGDGLHLANDNYFDGRVTVERVYLPDGRAALSKVFSLNAKRGRSPATACEACIHAGACHGPTARYLAEYGEGELQPVRRSDRPPPAGAGPRPGDRSAVAATGPMPR